MVCAMRCLCTAVLFLLACAHGPAPAGAGPDDDQRDWRRSIEAWRKQRAESIAGEQGWITLAGLSWLRPGENRLGADPSLELVLPKDRAPARAGSLFLQDGELVVEPAPGVDLRVDGKPIERQAIADDRDGKPTMMTLGSLTLFVIKRQDRYALRTKDREHPARRRFAGLSYYPLDPTLRVHAHLEPAPAGRTLPVVNVLGQVEQMPTPGILRFALGGVPYALAAVIEPGERELFILFKDRTAGQGTYPSGRFLYAAPPAADGSVELDFNRAFTPPCGYTRFATCPIPPRQNDLARDIKAGERYGESASD